MNPKKLAEAYRTLSMGYAELADAYLDDVDLTPTGNAPGHREPAAPSFDDLPPDEPYDTVYIAPGQDARQAIAEQTPQGSAAVCPKHRTPYKDGTYGPFCTQMSDDPAWANNKGYCRITPKNAAAYLRERASVTA